MLDNELTIQVDELNDDVLVPRVYSRFNTWENRSSFHGPDHTQMMRQVLSFFRSLSKKSGNYRGTAKSGFKITRDFEVEGVDVTTTIAAPAIAEVSFSIPVGVTTAELVELRQELVALLDDDTFMAKINEDQHI